MLNLKRYYSIHPVDTILNSFEHKSTWNLERHLYDFLWEIGVVVSSAHFSNLFWILHQKQLQKIQWVFGCQSRKINTQKNARSHIKGSYPSQSFFESFVVFVLWNISGSPCVLSNPGPISCHYVCECSPPTLLIWCWDHEGGSQPLIFWISLPVQQVWLNLYYF